MGQREFFTVIELSRALELTLEHISRPGLETDTVPLEECLGRYLAADFTAPEDVPPFRRSIMDGYAVRAADTFGATAGSPVYLDLAGSVSMGRATDLTVAPGQAVAMPTGGMLPEGADAVVMVEYAERIDGAMLEVGRDVAAGENVVSAGEDFRAGETILAAGHRIRPQDLGALAALGRARVDVVRRVRVGILSTGDEIVPVEEQPGPGQIRDVNAHSLAGLVEESGSVPVRLGTCRDEPELVRERLREGVATCDIVLLSGGSSVGAADIAPEVIASLGEPGIIVHGLAIKPGKPTIIAIAGGVPVFGLPGHPVSAFDVYVNIVDRLVRFYYTGDVAGPGISRRARARLDRNLASVSGREDRIRVTLEDKEGELWAHPVLGKSGLISLLVKADGVAVIPFASEGIERGETVTVELF